jgi:hypothetical protein
MKTMTKRDIADIALVWVILSCIFRLINYCISLGNVLVIYDDGLHSLSGRNQVIFTNIITIILSIVIIWILTSKRIQILDYFFPGAEETGLILKGEAIILTNYSFWIKLLGIFYLISSIITDLPNLLKILFYLIPKTSIENNSSTSLIEVKYGFFSIFLSIIVIWKADWIGEVLGRLGKNKLDK